MNKITFCLISIVGLVFLASQLIRPTVAQNYLHINGQIYGISPLVQNLSIAVGQGQSIRQILFNSTNTAGLSVHLQYVVTAGAVHTHNKDEILVDVFGGVGIAEPESYPGNLVALNVGDMDYIPANTPHYDAGSYFPSGGAYISFSQMRPFFNIPSSVFPLGITPTWANFRGGWAAGTVYGVNGNNVPLNVYPQQNNTLVRVVDGDTANLYLASFTANTQLKLQATYDVAIIQVSGAGVYTIPGLTAVTLFPGDTLVVQGPPEPQSSSDPSNIVFNASSPSGFLKNSALFFCNSDAINDTSNSGPFLVPGFFLAFFLLLLSRL